MKITKAGHRPAFFNKGMTKMFDIVVVGGGPAG
jgi:hypothetical protein